MVWLYKPLGWAAKAFQSHELINLQAPSHADVEDGFAQLWLSRGGHQERLKQYLNELGFADIGAASVGNRVALSMANVKSPRDVIKWSEAAYGTYEW